MVTKQRKFIPSCARFLRTALIAVMFLWPEIGHVAAEDLPAINSQEDAKLVAILVRSSLLALHHANLTGNYTVLRDLGSPLLRRTHTAADLARRFKFLQDKKLDLEAVSILQPDLEPKPRIRDKRLLTIMGSFPTKPFPIRFELVFELVSQTWLLADLEIYPAN